MSWFTDLLGSFSRSFTLGKGSAGPAVLDSAGNSAARTYTLQDASGVVPLYGPVITSTATGAQNDFNPTGLATASVLRLDPASALTITGLEAPSFAKELIVVNVSAQAVALNNEDAGSTAAKRFSFGGNVSLAQHQPLALVYDTASSRWRAAAQAGVTINDLTADSAPVGSADYVATWDASASATKKVLLENLLAGRMLLRGVLTVTPSANQNDYDPAGLGDAAVLRVNGSASLKLTGLAGGVDGRVVTVVNAATDYLLWLENENTASTAWMRFALPNGFPAFLMPGDIIELLYDGTAQRWRVKSWPTMGQAMGLSLFTDLVEGTLGPLTSTVSGTGASAQVSTYLMGTTERPMGITQIDTGTTATGRATLGNAGTGVIVPTLGAALSVARLAAEAANSGTETWQLICGFADSAGGTFTDGVAWNLRWNGSAAEWSQDRLSNSTATRSTTGSPTPDTNYIVAVVFVNPGWTRADFIYSTDSVSFTKADSPTTGLPGSARHTAWVAASIIKSVGTTQRNVSIDYAGCRVDHVRA